MKFHRSSLRRTEHRCVLVPTLNRQILLLIFCARHTQKLSVGTMKKGAKRSRPDRSSLASKLVACMQRNTDQTYNIIATIYYFQRDEFTTYKKGGRKHSIQSWKRNIKIITIIAGITLRNIATRNKWDDLLYVDFFAHLTTACFSSLRTACFQVHGLDNNGRFSSKYVRK